MSQILVQAHKQTLKVQRFVFTNQPFCLFPVISFPFVSSPLLSLLTLLTSLEGGGPLSEFLTKVASLILRLYFFFGGEEVSFEALLRLSD